MSTIIHRISIYLLLVILFSFSTPTLRQDKTIAEVKTIIFIDDFSSTSELEPNYYLYLEKIKERKLLGDMNVPSSISY